MSNKMIESEARGRGDCFFETQSTCRLLITLRAKLSGPVYCYRSCLWRAGGVCLWVCVFVGLDSVTTITRNCVHRSSPNWVGR